MRKILSLIILSSITICASAQRETDGVSYHILQDDAPEEFTVHDDRYTDNVTYVSDAYEENSDKCGIRFKLLKQDIILNIAFITVTLRYMA